MDIEIHPYNTTQGLVDQLNLTETAIKNDGYCRGGIWFEDTSTVICGTFPPKKEYHNRKGYIHYSSSKNQFWKHIDAIYGTSFFIRNDTANNIILRIENSLNKIEFAKTMRFGFVDIYSKVKRKIPTSSKDTDLIEVETIFNNGIFEELMEKGIEQFAFVYSLSRDVFIKELYKRYEIHPKTIRPYNTKNLPLEISTFKFKNKVHFLSYCPIHGRIEWALKQRALKSVIELTLIH